MLERDLISSNNQELYERTPLKLMSLLLNVDSKTELCLSSQELLIEPRAQRENRPKLRGDRGGLSVEVSV